MKILENNWIQDDEQGEDDDVRKLLQQMTKNLQILLLIRIQG